MKTAVLIVLFFSIPLCLLSQDVIVLKVDESVIKCNIESITDTSLTYKKWNSEDLTVYSISRSGVLSYFVDQNKSSDNVNLSDSNSSADDKNQKNKSHQGLLGVYKSNELVTGYIILNSGDTVSGLIQVENVAANQLEVAFTKSESEALVKYTPSQLIGYGYNNLQYLKIKSPIKGAVTNYKKSNSEYIFLHLMEDGPSQLFRLFTLKFKSNQLSGNSAPLYYLGKLNTHYVITNPSGDVVCTKGRTLKGSVNRIYNDNAVLKDEVYKNGVNEQRLPEIVEMYNKNYSVK